MAYSEFLRAQAVTELVKINPKYASQECHSILWVDAVDLMCELLEHRAITEGIEKMALEEVSDANQQ
jgi:hypothetical protein